VLKLTVKLSSNNQQKYTKTKARQATHGVWGSAESTAI